jgi:hypothetical protein
MSDINNEKNLEQLYEKYLEEGYSEIEARELTKKEMENKQ